VARLYLPALRPLNSGKTPALVRPNGATVAAAAGYYEYWGNYMLALSPTTDGFSARLGGGGPVEYVARADRRFWNDEDGTALVPVRVASGAVTGMTVIGSDGNRRVIPRLAPDFAGAAPISDPQPARTATVKTALLAMENGAQAVQASSAIAPGRKRDFSDPEDFGAVRALQLLHDEAVEDRGIARHGETIANVLAFRVKGDLHDADVLVYLTPAGLVADTDLSTE